MTMTGAYILTTPGLVMTPNFKSATLITLPLLRNVAGAVDRHPVLQEPS